MTDPVSLIEHLREESELKPGEPVGNLTWHMRLMRAAADALVAALAERDEALEHERRSDMALGEALEHSARHAGEAAGLAVSLKAAEAARDEARAGIALAQSLAKTGIDDAVAARDRLAATLTEIRDNGGVGAGALREIAREALDAADEGHVPHPPPQGEE